MNSNQSILNIVKQTIDLQSDSIKNLNKYLNVDFVDCVQLILKSKKISHLIVEEDNRYHGIIHIQNIIKEGII